MKHFLFSVLFFLLCIFAAHATHNRAGEITYRHLTGFQYEVTITTYTKTSGISIQADRPVLDSVFWGDGPSSFSSFNRINFIDLSGNPNDPDNIRVNTYVNTHLYPGSGSFDIHLEDPNRNEGIINIPNSVNQPFYLHTLLIVNLPVFPDQDNSPVLTYPPIDQGCVGVPFIHNPNAYDPDGDSLSYALTQCLGANGQPIPNFTYPAASVSLTVNSITGDLIWDSPILAGEYNVAMLIYSWRKVGTHYRLICTIERDMQIVIKSCNNNPPQIIPLADTCIVAGDTLSFDIHASDPDGNLVTLTSSGGPYIVDDPAQFTQPAQGNPVTGHFDWATKCHHIRRLPYHVQFKAQDNGSDVNLVDLEGMDIYVIGPPPTNPVATPSGNSIDLVWNSSACNNVTGYAIYRRNGLYAGTIECPCQTGVPAYTGYTLVGNTNGNDTTFTDDNNGNGLGIGNQYCYLIVALYSDGAESCASPQVCATLIKDLPAITNITINSTDQVNGSVEVVWSKPSELDASQYPGPYEYRLYHSTGFFGNNFDPNPIVVYNNLIDTTFVDTLMNTVDSAWSYKVELYYTNSGTLTLKGTTQKASSVYLKLSPTDKRINLSWEEHVPWTNTSYDIFRLDTASGSLTFDSIGTSTVQSFSDTGLTNGNQYCYYIRSVGGYTSPGFVDPIINLSQRACAVPSDNVPPCAPHLNVVANCEEEENNLTWNNPNLSCADDVVRYNIYFNSPAVNDYILIATINDPNTTSYIHANLSSLTGCYKITAVDSTGNESTDAIEFCVDSCRQYVLPSVFTPDGDGFNDFFHPCDETTSLDLQQKNCPPYKNVKDVVMKIYNRWGNLVFETTDKDVNWDGKNKNNGKECSEGVYFYTCTVNFYRLDGIESKELHGHIQLIRKKQ